MSLLDRAKDFVSDDGEGVDQEPNFEEEFEGPDEVDSAFEDEEEDPVEETLEWETAYRFADDALENLGFNGTKGFIPKAMVYRIDRSPMYRDQIESGLATMERITSSMQDVQEIRNDLGAGDEMNYKEYAEQVKGANELLDEVDRMSGKEEQMANEILGVAKDLARSIGEQRAAGGNIDSSMGVSDEGF